MKKVILFAAILFAGISVVKADEPAGLTNSDEVILNVKLNPIQTLVVNSGQKTVDLVYSTTDDYSKGVSLEQKDHLKIYSTGAFAVQVKSSHANIKRVNGEQTIASSGLAVQAADGANDVLTGTTMAKVNLSETATDFITSTVGGVNKNFNVTYSGLDGDAYVNKYFKDENPTVYSTTVTYSIVAR